VFVLMFIKRIREHGYLTKKTKKKLLTNKNTFYLYKVK